MIKKNILVIALLLISLNISANCELSWVKDKALDHHWIHTTAVYRQENPSYVFAQLVTTPEKRLRVNCPNHYGEYCRKLQKLNDGLRSCNLSKPTELPGKEELDYSEEHISPWVTDSCSKLNPNKEIVSINNKGGMQLPKSYPLRASKSEDTNFALEKDIRAIAELKKVPIRALYLPSGTDEEPTMDLSKMRIKKIIKFSNSYLKNSSVLEVRFSVKLDDFPNKFELPIESKTKLVDYPVILINFKNKWHLFGHGVIGQCVSALDEKTKKINFDSLISKRFGTPVNYVFHDFNHDGVMDALQLSAYYHLPGTINLYHLESDSSIKVGDEFCLPSFGKCAPWPGC